MLGTLVTALLRPFFRCLTGVPLRGDKELPEPMFFLRDFLHGEDPKIARGIYGYKASDRRPARAMISGGGFELLYRIEGGAKPVYLLNMDHSKMPDMPVPEWREKALRAASEVGVELLPVSERAYRRVAVEGQQPRLAHRDGFEAVFTVAGPDGIKYYLSGYDQQEKPPLYFLCRLPRAVSTVDEAREALKPESVRIALAAGAEVRRQGDLFFIETGLDDDAIEAAGGEVVCAPEVNPSLYGTAHEADLVARLPGAVMLASGTVRHAPAGRAADHGALELGDAWWIVSRNTVPAERRPQPTQATLDIDWDSWFGDASARARHGFPAGVGDDDFLVQSFEGYTTDMGRAG